MAVDHVADSVDLAALVEDPARVATVPPGRIPALLSQLSALQGAMAARLISADRDETVSSEDTLLTVDQAAERLGVSTDWLFRRSRTLPFVVRLGRHLAPSAELRVKREITPKLPAIFSIPILRPRHGGQQLTRKGVDRFLLFAL